MLNFKNFLEQDVSQVKDVCQRLPSNAKVTILDKPFDLQFAKIGWTGRPHKDLHSIDQKPRGLWYACGDEWYTYCSSAFKDRYDEFRHVYLLDIDMSKMLVFKTPEQLLEFHKKFKHNTGSYANINWVSVSERYSGIEICPHHWGLRRKLSWYSTWSVASGCVWDLDIIKNVKELTGADHSRSVL